MRALAGPAMLLVLIGGYGVYRATSAPGGPSRDFLDLELAGADRDRTGSCYSLSTILVANLAFSTALAKWTPAGDDGWTLALEEVTYEGGTPSHVYQRFTFREQEGLARLVSVEASKGQATSVDTNVDALLVAPNERRSTPVERCLEAGASGYRFRERR